MSRRSESDEWLMGQVRLENRDSLGILVRRYASPLLTFIRRMVGDAHQSEELFQEVFLAVWTKRKQYKLNHRFRSWLYAIAANRCRSEYRKASLPISPAADATLTSSGDGSPPQTAIATETAVLVEQAVAQLPKTQRTVVVLRIWDGLTYAEIAEVLGQSENTARSHMHRGLAVMREFLEPKL